MDKHERKRLSVEAKAKTYLYRVCEVVGAIAASPVWTHSALYQTRDYQFLVRPGSVERRNLRTGHMQHTCVRHQQRMPEAEMVASVLLCLHDDPEKFELWYIESYTIRF